jgi:hypothetical protein
MVQCGIARRAATFSHGSGTNARRAVPAGTVDKTKSDRKKIECARRAFCCAGRAGQRSPRNKLYSTSAAYSKLTFAERRTTLYFPRQFLPTAASGWHGYC